MTSQCNWTAWSGRGRRAEAVELFLVKAAEAIVPELIEFLVTA